MSRARHVPDVGVLIENGRIFEQAGNLERALASYRSAANAAVEESLRALALRHQSMVLRDLCEWEDALNAARESAQVAKSFGFNDLFASALNAEAGIHTTKGDFAAAVPLFERVLTLTDDSHVQGNALQNLGCIYAISQEFQSAEHYLTESFSRFRRIGDEAGMLATTRNFGAAALDHGDFELAEAVSLQAMDGARSSLDFSGEMTALKNYAESLIAQGKDLEDAESRAVVALGFFAGSGNIARRIECLRLLGDLAVMRDDWRGARLAYLQALDLAQHLGLLTEVRRLSERLDLLSLDDELKSTDDTPTI